VPVFRIWLLSFLLLTFQPHGVLRVYGDTRFLAVQNFVKILVVAALIGPAISTFGLAGGVLSSAIASTVGKCMLLMRMKRLMRVPASSILPWRRLAGAAGMSVIAAAAALAAGYFVPPGAALRLFLISAIYATALALVLGLLIGSSSHNPPLRKKLATLWET
jgi:O-antigen/teichoic acid export membrane protein